MQDVFSAGCVLAEMFLDGKLLFDRPQVTLLLCTTVKTALPAVYHRTPLLTLKAAVLC